MENIIKYMIFYDYTDVNWSYYRMSCIWRPNTPPEKTKTGGFSFKSVIQGGAGGGGGGGRWNKHKW